MVCQCNSMHNCNKMIYLSEFPDDTATPTPADMVEWHACWLDKYA